LKKKLTLNELAISSFVTGTRSIENVGGASCDCTLPTGRICLVACPTFFCTDKCPSTNCSVEDCNTEVLC